MKIALLRVGIDSGSGGMHGPLFKDGRFEYIPIPDVTGHDERIYGNTRGRHGKELVEYFPERRRANAADQSIHFDPEFVTFTYGDPSRPKSGLRRLEQGDMLIFYCGLEGYGFKSEPALYLLGYFEILAAGRAVDFTPNEITMLFSENFHVRHPGIYRRQRGALVLVKGSSESRLLKKAICISEAGQNRSGKPLKVLSRDMQKIFGDFDGKISIQRSPPRWVKASHVIKAAAFMRSLERPI